MRTLGTILATLGGVLALMALLLGGGPEFIVLAIVSVAGIIIVAVTKEKQEEMQPDDQRHGCLTSVLALMISASFFTGIWYAAVLLRIDWPELNTKLPLAQHIYLLLYILGSFINVACGFALLKWRKWGFYTMCVMSVIFLAMNLSFRLGWISFAGLLGIVLLYGVLMIGREQKGWAKLR